MVDDELLVFWKVVAGMGLYVLVGLVMAVLFGSCCRVGERRTRQQPQGGVSETPQGDRNSLKWDRNKQSHFGPSCCPAAAGLAAAGVGRHLVASIFRRPADSPHAHLRAHEAAAAAPCPEVQAWWRRFHALPPDIRYERTERGTL